MAEAPKTPQVVAERTRHWLEDDYPIDQMQQVRDPQVRIAAALEYIAHHTKKSSEMLQEILALLHKEKGS